MHAIKHTSMAIQMVSLNEDTFLYFCGLSGNVSFRWAGFVTLPNQPHRQQKKALLFDVYFFSVVSSGNACRESSQKRVAKDEKVSEF